MDRKELKRIQKQNTTKYDNETDNGYCWYDNLNDAPTVTFQKGDTLSLMLFAWKPTEYWNNKDKINKNPITVEEAEQFGEVVLESIEDEPKLDAFKYSFYIKFKKEITSEEFIPVIYTLTNHLMNEKNLTPRQHWIESIEKQNENTSTGLTFNYTISMRDLILFSDLS